MSILLRRRTNNLSLSKRLFCSSPPGNLIPKTPHDRPISLRFRVNSLIELSQLYKAGKVSSLAAPEKYRGLDSEHMMMRNEIIGAMCTAKRYQDAVNLYDFFSQELAADDNVDTLRLMTKLFVDTGKIYTALNFVKSRQLWDPVAYSYLIRGFLDLEKHDKAYELFDELNHKIVPDDNKKAVMVVDATFVDYWFKQGEGEKAMEIYRSIISREGESVCGNALLEILLDNGKQTEAWDLFESMITNSSKTFDRETFVSTMVNACFKLGQFNKALDVFMRPELTRSSRCYANIIARFCERGMMFEAEALFAQVCSDQLLCPDVPTFRSMINGYAKCGRVEDAIEMLKKMVAATLLKFAVHEAHY